MVSQTLVNLVSELGKTEDVAAERRHAPWVEVAGGVARVVVVQMISDGEFPGALLNSK